MYKIIIPKLNGRKLWHKSFLTEKLAATKKAKPTKYRACNINGTIIYTTIIK